MILMRRRSPAPFMRPRAELKSEIGGRWAAAPVPWRDLCIIDPNPSSFVIPAKAGTHTLRIIRRVHGVWVPACAGMTGEVNAVSRALPTCAGTALFRHFSGISTAKLNKFLLLRPNFETIT